MAQVRLISGKVITAEVLRRMDKNSPRSLDLVSRHLPAFLRPFDRLFARVPGSRIYRELQRGRLSLDVLLTRD